MSAWDKLADRIGLELERVRADFAAGLAETRNAMRVRGVRREVIPANGGRVSSGAGRLVGWSVRETSGGAPVTLELYEGVDQVDQQNFLAAIQADAGKVATSALPAPGIDYSGGITVVVVSGAFRGALLFGAVD